MSLWQALSLPCRHPATSLLPEDNNRLYGHLCRDTILPLHPVVHGHSSDKKQNYAHLSLPSDVARDAQTESGSPADENVLRHCLQPVRQNEYEDWPHTTSDAIPSLHIWPSKPLFRLPVCVWQPQEHKESHSSRPHCKCGSSSQNPLRHGHGQLSYHSPITDGNPVAAR